MPGKLTSEEKIDKIVMNLTSFIDQTDHSVLLVDKVKRAMRYEQAQKDLETLRGLCLSTFPDYKALPNTIEKLIKLLAEPGSAKIDTADETVSETLSKRLCNGVDPAFRQQVSDYIREIDAMIPEQLTKDRGRILTDSASGPAAPPAPLDAETPRSKSPKP